MLFLVLLLYLSKMGIKTLMLELLRLFFECLSVVSIPCCGQRTCAFRIFINSSETFKSSSVVSKTCSLWLGQSFYCRLLRRSSSTKSSWFCLGWSVNHARLVLWFFLLLIFRLFHFNRRHIGQCFLDTLELGCLHFHFNILVANVNDFSVGETSRLDRRCILGQDLLSEFLIAEQDNRLLASQLFLNLNTTKEIKILTKKSRPLACWTYLLLELLNRVASVHFQARST